MSQDLYETNQANERLGRKLAITLAENERLERELDKVRKKLSYKTQTWILAEGTIGEQFRRIVRMEAEVMDLKRSAKMNGEIWDESRKRTENITRKCCDAIGVLRRGGEDHAMLAELREILLPNVHLSEPKTTNDP